MRARLLVVTASLLFPAVAAAGSQPPPVSVRETASGTYAVSARFEVPESADVVHAVLTDYANIPRYLPGIRRSVLLARGHGHARVEQEAVSKFMLFSKTVHLVLDVFEEPGAIRFRDEGGKSFHLYEGTWTLTPTAGGTMLVYTLTARPAFAVPGAVLGRVLSRDAEQMIGGLRAEFTRRALRAAGTE